MTGPRRRSDPDDYDEIEVERLMGGDLDLPLRYDNRRGRPLRPETVEAVRRLIGQGMSDLEVSERLRGRMSPGAVRENRYRYGISSHPDHA